MSTFLGIVIAAVSVLTLAVVAWAFTWAAKKDGEEDGAVQKRLLGSGDSPRRILPLIVEGHSGTLARQGRRFRRRRYAVQRPARISVLGLGG